MADEAIAGEARLGTLVAVGKANYVPLLLGYFVLLAVNMIFGFLAFMGAIIIVIIGGSIAGMGGGVGTGMGGGAGTGVDAPVVGFDPTLLAVVGVVAVGLVLAYLLVTFSSSLRPRRRSRRERARRRVPPERGLVRSNLLSVFGYTVLLLVGSLLVGTPRCRGVVRRRAATAGKPDRRAGSV